jgi:hypothetical protein
VPFTVTIPEADRDPRLGDKLKAEWPQILGWMIDGCLAWQRRGLDPPKIVQAATETLPLQRGHVRAVARRPYHARRQRVGEQRRVVAVVAGVGHERRRVRRDAEGVQPEARRPRLRRQGPAGDQDARLPRRQVEQPARRGAQKWRKTLMGTHRTHSASITRPRGRARVRVRGIYAGCVPCVFTRAECRTRDGDVRLVLTSSMRLPCVGRPLRSWCCPWPGTRGH